MSTEPDTCRFLIKNSVKKTLIKVNHFGKHLPKNWYSSLRFVNKLGHKHELRRKAPSRFPVSLQKGGMPKRWGWKKQRHDVYYRRFYFYLVRFLGARHLVHRGQIRYKLEFVRSSLAWIDRHSHQNNHSSKKFSCETDTGFFLTDFKDAQFI